MDGLIKGVAKVNKRLANGTTKTYYYAWRGGPQLLGEPGSPEFVRSYEAICAARAEHDEQPVVSVPCLDGLIERYKRSDEFKSKAKSTRREYERYLKLIGSTFDDLPIEALNDKRVRGDFKEWRDTLSATPRTADFAWSVLARLMSFAVDRGIIDRNPCERGGRLYKADRNELIWSEAQLQRLESSASPEIAAVVTFALWTGQRQADCLAARWTDLEAETLKVKQAKGGRTVSIPIAAALAKVLETLPRTKAKTILTNSRGEAWTSSGFRASYRKAVAKAGIVADLHFHDLRGTAVTRMALAGCSSLQIAAITGHAPRHVDDILESHYLGGQVELASQAMRKLETHRAPNEPLQTNLQTE